MSPLEAEEGLGAFEVSGFLVQDNLKLFPLWEGKEPVWEKRQKKTEIIFKKVGSLLANPV